MYSFEEVVKADPELAKAMELVPTSTQRVIRENVIMADASM